jgi:hypothetical protein
MQQISLVTALHVPQASWRSPWVAGLAIAVETSTAQPPKKEPKMSERKRQVVDLLKSIETGDPNPAAVINPKKYVQHNLAVGNGVAGVVALLRL